MPEQLLSWKQIVNLLTRESLFMPESRNSELGSQNSPATLRRAIEADQATIKKMVWDAHLDPSELHWSHFMLAELEGQIVAIGQIRPYPGCPELGSIVTLPEYRGRGLAGQIIKALLESGPRPMYLECLYHNVTFYQRFGFAEIPWQMAPQPLRGKHRIAGLIGNLIGRKLAAVMVYPNQA
jgi:amino-acid N-acetyltransferase